MAVGTVSSVDNDVWQLIATNSPSAASNSSFTSISGYKKLMITWQLTGVSATMSMRLNNDTTDGNYGGIAVMFYTYANRVTDRLPLTGYTDGTNTGYVIVKDTDKTTPKIVEDLGGIDAGFGSGVWLGNSAVTQVDIFPHSGTFSGTIKLYGIAA